MLRRFAACRPVAGARALHIPITEPLGKGRVVPLKFETLKPAYVPRSWTDQFITHYTWMWSNQIVSFVIAFCVIWGAHGGFSGHLPPDVHELFP